MCNQSDNGIPHPPPTPPEDEWFRFPCENGKVEDVAASKQQFLRRKRSIKLSDKAEIEEEGVYAGGRRSESAGHVDDLTAHVDAADGSSWTSNSSQSPSHCVHSVVHNSTCNQTRPCTPLHRAIPTPIVNINNDLFIATETETKTKTVAVHGSCACIAGQPSSAQTAHQRRRSSRKLAPGLLARLELLDTRLHTSFLPSTGTKSIGRISQSRIQEFDNKQVHTEEADRRNGKLRCGSFAVTTESSLPATLPEATKSESTYPFATIFSMATMVQHDDIASDMSSILSVSDHPVLSESDEDHIDTQKYMLPDISKSRGSSRNGFALPDGRVVGREQPPTPPPKDSMYSPLRPSMSASSESLNSALDQFNPYDLQRTNSIYTISRASLSNQLSQLTSIKLPDATSLESSISSIPTAIAAARVLNEAAGQIKIWITKANEVLEGLDADDDVEWSAAAGREGLAEVDQAINTFNSLIVVFVNTIDNLGSRPDIGRLSNRDQSTIVDRGERIVEDWGKIKMTLEGVKEQVEVAMEWEELWNTVLGEIGQEEESLSRYIFEMEEKRHKNSLLDAMAEPGQNLDIKELETIVEEAPIRMDITSPSTEEAPSAAQTAAQDESSLVALTARMQPLRASLDFLPMRLSGFLTRGKDAFPTACEELETRMRTLEQKYEKLNADAEALRKELGEDRWVLIFRKAGRQALKMCQSVDRSIAKLRDSLDDGAHHTNPPMLTKKIENYEAKKEHYGPAIQQVLAIIDRGVSTRLTVNGEILRLQADMHRRWSDTEALIKSMNFALDQLNISRTKQLRDSVSTILSEQRSVTSSAGTFADTPLSSPASSVIMLARNPSDGSGTPLNSKSRQGSFTSISTAHRRTSHLPTPVRSNRPNLSVRASTSRLSSYAVSSRLYPGPTPRAESRTQTRHDDLSSTMADRPRWNSSTKIEGSTVGHNFKSLSASVSSPYAGMRSTQSSMNLRQSTIAARPPSRLNPSRNVSASVVPTTPASHAKRAMPPSIYATPSATPGLPRGLKHRAHSSISSTGSSSAQTERHNPLITPNDTPTTTLGQDSPADESPSTRAAPRPSLASRPGSVMGASTGGRRVSMLPTPKKPASGIATAAAVSAMSGTTSVPSGRTSRLSRGASSLAIHSVTEERPRWR